MLISTKGRYGVKAVLDLAARGADGPVPIKAIAERQDLPEAYLEQLMSPLRKAGIVRSVRGAQGGYVLARPASAVTVAAVVEALEGPIEIAACTCGGEAPDCLEHTLWRKLGETIRQFLDGATLASILEDQAAAAATPFYHI